MFGWYNWGERTTNMSMHRTTFGAWEKRERYWFLDIQDEGLRREIFRILSQTFRQKAPPPLEDLLALEKNHPEIIWDIYELLVDLYAFHELRCEFSISEGFDEGTSRHRIIIEIEIPRSASYQNWARMVFKPKRKR